MVFYLEAAVRRNIYIVYHNNNKSYQIKKTRFLAQRFSTLALTGPYSRAITRSRGHSVRTGLILVIPSSLITTDTLYGDTAGN